MSHRSFTTSRILGRVVAIAAIGLSLQAFAVAAEPAPTTTPDVAAELEALRARVAQLESNQKTADAAVAQSRAIDAAIRDANSRPSLFDANTLTSGWQNGFHIRSADGNYDLQPYVESQFRYTANDTGDANDFSPGSGDDDFQFGFEVRRLKFGIKGNAFNPNFRYNFRLSADRSSGTVNPDLAYGEYQFAPEWGVRFGQYKLNWTHEETLSDTRQLTIERSLMNQLIGGGNTQYVQGIALLYGSKTNPFHAELSFTDGDLSDNTNYTDQQGSATERYQDFGVSARGEYKVFGDWDNYADFTARKTTQQLLVVGGGTDWAQGGDGDVYRFTVDAQYEHPNGLSAYASAIYTTADGDDTADAIIDNSYGALAQVGYLLPGLTDWEIFGRYDFIKLDDETPTGGDFFQEFAIGANKYFVGHNAKLTFDFDYLPGGSYTGAGGLGVTNTEERQIIFRTQFQLLL